MRRFGEADESNASHIIEFRASLVLLSPIRVCECARFWSSTDFWSVRFLGRFCFIFFSGLLFFHCRLHHSIIWICTRIINKCFAKFGHFVDVEFCPRMQRKFTEGRMNGFTLARATTTASVKSRNSQWWLRLVRATSGKYLPHQTNEVDVYGAHTAHSPVWCGPTTPLRHDSRRLDGSHARSADDDAFEFIHALNRFTLVQPTLHAITCRTPLPRTYQISTHYVCWRAHTFNRKWWKYLLFHHRRRWCRSIYLAAYFSASCSSSNHNGTARRLNSRVVIIHKCRKIFYRRKLTTYLQLSSSSAVHRRQLKHSTEVCCVAHNGRSFGCHFSSRSQIHSQR